MNSGKRFEQNLKNSIDTKEIYYFRLKDSPSSFGQDSNFTRFTLNNPYDAFCFYMCSLFPLELKSTKYNSFSIQMDKEEKSKMIKLHQIKGLREANKYPNSYAGFLFNFINEKDNIEETYWLSIKSFDEFLEFTDKKSINKDDVILYDGILVNSEKKKVNYRYNVKKLLEQICTERNEYFGTKDVPKSNCNR